MTAKSNDINFQESNETQKNISLEEFNKEAWRVFKIVAESRFGNVDDHYTEFAGEFVFHMTPRTFTDKRTGKGNWWLVEIKMFHDFCEPQKGDSFKINPMDAIIKNYFGIK